MFVVLNDVLYTPNLASYLYGIAHARAIQLAMEAHLTIVEKRITRDEIYCADEAFFTGSAAEITPPRGLDDPTIGAGTRGPFTEALKTRFFDAVAGRSPTHLHDWPDHRATWSWNRRSRVKAVQSDERGRDTERRQF
ncbi:Branched-chain amino acid aminotransferase [Paraburkholderia caribensis]|nr:Branched-chain amino acid aminotransferase [Paraburkholderia caribensis]